MRRERKNLAPCGTEAAARRHHRHGQPLDEACRAAAIRARAEREGADPYAQLQPETRGAVRNGLPVVAYKYGAPRPSWAVENIRRAEQVYGKPPPELDFEAG